jgi:hypothetical protein
MKTHREVKWSVSRLVLFTPGKISDAINCLGGWVCPRAGLDAVK